MNDIRRTILWVIFGFSMVLLWDQWQIHNGHKATFFPAPVAANAPAASGASPAAGKNTDGSVNTAGVPTPAAVAAGPATAAVPTNEQRSAPRERIEVSTDVLRVQFDSEGASVSRVEFLKHADLTHPQQNMVLLDDSKERFYQAQSGLFLPCQAWLTPPTKHP